MRRRHRPFRLSWCPARSSRSACGGAVAPRRRHNGSGGGGGASSHRQPLRRLRQRRSGGRGARRDRRRRMRAPGQSREGSRGTISSPPSPAPSASASASASVPRSSFSCLLSEMPAWPPPHRPTRLDRGASAAARDPRRQRAPRSGLGGSALLALRPRRLRAILASRCDLGCSALLAPRPRWQHAILASRRGLGGSTLLAPRPRQPCAPRAAASAAAVSSRRDTASTALACAARHRWEYRRQDERHRVGLA